MRSRIATFFTLASALTSWKNELSLLCATEALSYLRDRTRRRRSMGAEGAESKSRASGSEHWIFSETGMLAPRVYDNC